MEYAVNSQHYENGGRAAGGGGFGVGDAERGAALPVRRGVEICPHRSEGRGGAEDRGRAEGVRHLGAWRRAGRHVVHSPARCDGAGAPDPLTPRRPSPFCPFPVRRTRKQILRGQVRHKSEHGKGPGTRKRTRPGKPHGVLVTFCGGMSARGRSARRSRGPR